MRKITLSLLAVLMLTSFSFIHQNQIKQTEAMNNKEQIIRVCNNFIEGADEQDLERLAAALHKKFSNVQNGYFGESGVHLINRESYLEHVAKGKFGGIKRSVEFRSVDVNGDMAMVHVFLAHQYLHFDSYISLVLERNEWKVIGNFPKIALVEQP